MKKLIAVLVIALSFVVGCSTGEAPAPAPVVTVTEQAPSVDPQDEFVDGVFEEVWAGMTIPEQMDACEGYNAFPDYMWQSFSDGLDKYEGVVTREQFDAFFSSKC